jgi:hypothetical protein
MLISHVHFSRFVVQSEVRRQLSPFSGTLACDNRVAFMPSLPLFQQSSLIAPQLVVRALHKETSPIVIWDRDNVRNPFESFVRCETKKICGVVTKCVRVSWLSCSPKQSRPARLGGPPGHPDDRPPHSLRSVYRQEAGWRGWKVGVIEKCVLWACG